MSREPERSSVAIWLDMPSEALARLARRLAPHALGDHSLAELDASVALRRNIIFACYRENIQADTTIECDE